MELVFRTAGRFNYATVLTVAALAAIAGSVFAVSLTKGMLRERWTLVLAALPCAVLLVITLLMILQHFMKPVYRISNGTVRKYSTAFSFSPAWVESGGTFTEVVWEYRAYLDDTPNSSDNPMNRRKSWRTTVKLVHPEQDKCAVLFDRPGSCVEGRRTLEDVARNLHIDVVEIRTGERYERSHADLDKSIGQLIAEGKRGFDRGEVAKPEGVSIETTDGVLRIHIPDRPGPPTAVLIGVFTAGALVLFGVATVMGGWKVGAVAGLVTFIFGLVCAFWDTTTEEIIELDGSTLRAYRTVGKKQKVEPVIEVSIDRIEDIQSPGVMVVSDSASAALGIRLASEEDERWLRATLVRAVSRLQGFDIYQLENDTVTGQS